MSMLDSGTYDSSMGRSCIWIALAIFGALLVSSEADGSPVTLKCQAIDPDLEESGPATFVLDKEARSLKEIGGVGPAAELEFKPGQVLVEGNVLRADDGPVSLVLDLASGKGEVFLGGDTATILKCLQQD